MNIQIRQENANDYKEIYDLIHTAFQTAKVSDGDEQDYAMKLRESENYIPELALVAEQEGKLVGHIMLTTTTIYQTDGDKCQVLLLSPLSVLYEYRNQGIGGSLIDKGLEMASERGFKAVVLCGDPDYYCRFGFQEAANFDIMPDNAIPPQYVLACELYPQALDGITGLLDCC